MSSDDTVQVRDASTRTPVAEIGTADDAGIAVSIEFGPEVEER